MSRTCIRERFISRIFLSAGQAGFAGLARQPLPADSSVAFVAS